MRFIKFLVVGTLNTGLTFLLYLVLLKYAHYPVAYTIAFISGIVISYVLNSTFVFADRSNVTAMMRFPLVYLVQYFWGAMLLTLLVGTLGIGKEIAMGVVVITTVLLTYIIMTWVFEPRRLRGSTHVSREGA